MRRPIASRQSLWAQRIARALASRGVRPNAVSGASVVFALLAALCLFAAPRVEGRLLPVALFLGAALCIQLRLLCNLFDGMLAVEFGQASSLGPLWNDFPDRPADVFILVGCGLSGGSAWLPMLGAAAALLALLTAYTRVLGAAVGAREHFTGPMAKPQRMALATLACAVAALEAALSWPHHAMALALILIVLGCALTTARRLQLIARDLTEGAAKS